MLLIYLNFNIISGINQGFFNISNLQNFNKINKQYIKYAETEIQKSCKVAKAV